MRVQMFDVDEVILRFGGPFVDFLNQRLGSSHDSAKIKIYDLEKALRISPEVFNEAYLEFINSDRIGELGRYADAVEYINSLPSDVKVVFVTALESSPHTRKARKRNLEGIRHDKLIFTKDRTRLSKILEPEAIFEDKPRNVELYLTRGGKFGRIYVPRRSYAWKLEEDLNGDDRVRFYDSMLDVRWMTESRGGAISRIISSS